MNPTLLYTAEKLVDILKSKNLKIATAESCTGGMVSAYITAVSGASSVFEMGLTSYSNRIKNKALKVKKETLDSFGAVSVDTAKQMAQNICFIADADIGVSVTGVAGPAQQDGYSVGTVFIAVYYQNKTETIKLNIEPLDRNYVREQTVLKLFEAIITRLS